MAEDDTTKPKAAGSSGDGNDAVDDEGHEEAAEILANLLQNQAVVPSTNADGTTAIAAAAGGEDVRVGAAGLTTTTGSGDNPEAVIQQMLQQLKLGGAVALPSEGGIDAERKHHAFWDTQVSNAFNEMMSVDRLPSHHLLTQSPISLFSSRWI